MTEELIFTLANTSNQNEFRNGLFNLIFTIVDNSKENMNSFYHIQYPQGTQFINDTNMFKNSSFISIFIPNTVSDIETYSFCGCNTLRNVCISKHVVRPDDKYYSHILRGLFMNCIKLESLLINIRTQNPKELLQNIQH